MATNESDLWPADLVVDVLSPTMILNEQAEALAKRTQGIVRGEIYPGNAGQFEQLIFDLVAPAVGVRQRILNVRFAHDFPYPVVLLAKPFDFKDDSGWPHAQAAPARNWNLSNDEVYLSRLAHSPAEMRDLLKLVFNAPQTRAMLFSLIARSNEVTGPPQRPGTETKAPIESSPDQLEPTP
ncbi:hypothetical protein R5W23_003544 [Gemmata sp. JC673]|uniref:DUF2589 domain-containing protein n=1 Tax=Gemmata algarum TaxID=2975278 RepID=A0ABU5F3E5_9BACT|nr:hypothetical protein [Gemmata algarum]MDY3562098.1 hypothetical protein [Gemmata algarum]